MNAIKLEVWQQTIVQLLAMHRQDIKRQLEQLERAVMNLADAEIGLAKEWGGARFQQESDGSIVLIPNGDDPETTGE